MVGLLLLVKLILLFIILFFMELLVCFNGWWYYYRYWLLSWLDLKLWLDLLFKWLIDCMEILNEVWRNCWFDGVCCCCRGV